MYIEKRKNGTFYLKESIYNPVTKSPKNTSIYLGSNPIQAREKLKSLTDDPDLLAEIPDVPLYQIEIDRAIHEFQKLCDFRSESLRKFMEEHHSELLRAKQFLESAQTGTVLLTADCHVCRFKEANYCKHFQQYFFVQGVNYGTKSGPCMACEKDGNKQPKGTIKLPRDFRSIE